ncbi:Hypothetical protein NTJ_14156 [Nesidiocoris tenuis]|uniref:Uncharacterized protein n=1 Tax=Nesidiocoris tenuis TaxID=355587 RepID=A0ABN7BCD7_9HEMI|nr:Hypothetical protein NTJ_14156 [Nesidiocoris tenuis]
MSLSERNALPLYSGKKRPGTLKSGTENSVKWSYITISRTTVGGLNDGEQEMGSPVEAGRGARKEGMSVARGRSLMAVESVVEGSNEEG